MPAAVDTLSEGELADACGVTRPAVTQWRESGCPHRKQGGRYRYVLVEVMNWRIERAARTARDDSAPDEGKERARKLRADADRAELELARARAELVPAADFDTALDGAFERVRASYLSLPDEIARAFPEVGMRDGRRRGRAIVDSALHRLDAGADVPDGDASDDADEDEA